MKPIILTLHARERASRRKLRLDWIEQAARRPLWTEPDPFDGEVERRFLPIEEFGGRVLRVAVVETPDAIRVISAMFDRGARRKP